MNTTGWLKGLQVTRGWYRDVSHAGVALVRALADNTGLTAGPVEGTGLEPAAGP